MLNKKKNNKGFTLVELLVVIAIIGILAVVAVPALFKNIEKGKVADLEADISAIRSAALSVYADTSKLPVDQTIDGKYEGEADKNTIDSELEGLSNPFKATYTTAMESNQLVLTITAETGISESGMKKLKDDLSGKLISPKDSALEDGKAIKVELMSK